MEQGYYILFLHPIMFISLTICKADKIQSNLLDIIFLVQESLTINCVACCPREKDDNRHYPRQVLPSFLRHVSVFSVDASNTGMVSNYTTLYSYKDIVLGRERRDSKVS